MSFFSENFSITYVWNIMKMFLQSHVHLQSWLICTYTALLYWLLPKQPVWFTSSFSFWATKKPHLFNAGHVGRRLTWQTFHTWLLSGHFFCTMMCHNFLQALGILVYCKKLKCCGKIRKWEPPDSTQRPPRKTRLSRSFKGSNYIIFHFF